MILSCSITSESGSHFGSDRNQAGFIEQKENSIVSANSHFSSCCAVFLLTGFLCMLPGQANPALERVDPAVIFLLNFNDQTLYPEISLGEVEPVQVSGSPVFAEGRFGKALLLGGPNGVQIQYRAFRNLDFSRPGALSFWMAPQQWLQPADVQERPYLRFFHLQGAGAGYVFLQRQGFVNRTSADGSISRRTDMFQAGCYSFAHMKNLLLGTYDSLHWKNGEWRFFVLNWSRDGLSLSVNGKSAAQAQFSRPITPEDFPESVKKPMVFRLGSGKSEETTLLDELVIYRRNLTEEEISSIYQAFLP